MRYILGIALFLTSLGLRILWSCDPGLFVCCAFWVTIATANVVTRQWWLLPGLLSNGTVTIANGGVMPVFGSEKVTGPIHVQGTPEAALQFLCDQFYGFSVGDVLLLAGLSCSIAIALNSRARLHAVVGGS